MTQTRRFILKRHGWALLSAALLLAACAAVWRQPHHFLPDDSYFYLEIARHLAAGHGSTFNGVMPTNGYHPLWMLLCTGVYILTAALPAITLRTVVVLQQLLALAAAALLGGAVRRFTGPWAWIAAGGFSLYLLTGMYGSEAHLNAFCCALALWLTVARKRRGAALEALTGMVLGLGVLARLDNLFVLGALGVYALGRIAIEDRRRAARALALIGSAALPPALYLAGNAAWFGHLMPVSGAIKSTFPIPHWNPAQVSLLGRLVLLGALTALVLALARRDRLYWLGLAAVGVMAHAGYLAVFSRRFTLWSWYYVPGVMVGAIAASIAACELARRLPQRIRRYLPHAAVLLLVSLTAMRAWIKADNPDAISFHNPLAIQPKQAERSWEQQMALFLRDRLPPGSRILMWDLPGVVGYFTDHEVIPLDGLVGSYDFSDALLQDGVAAYLGRASVDYWIGPLVSDGSCRTRAGAWRISRRGEQQCIEVFTPLYPDRSAGVFHVYDEDLVAALPEVLDHPKTWAVGVWRIRY